MQLQKSIPGNKTEFIIIAQIRQYQRIELSMRQSISKEQPVAMLVLYDKGFKFKYTKYYIRKGSNIIGGHPNCHCQIVGQSTEKIPDKAANLIVTDQLATIEPLVPGAVFVLSNIKRRSNLMVQIQTGSKYVIQMEKDFIVCGRKALMQISTLQQLLQVKGVANQQLFDLSVKNSQPISQKFEKPAVISSQFQATVPLQDNYNFQATVPLDNQFQFQTTQRIDDEQQILEATLPLDIDLIPQSYKPPLQRQKLEDRQSFISLNKSKIQQIPSSLPKVQYSQNQKILKQDQNKTSQQNSIKKVVSQAQISMPSTIKQDQQMPATIKEDDENNNMDSQNPFPPTIQQADRKNTANLNGNTILRPSTLIGDKKPLNLTKSEPVYKQMKNSKFSQPKQFHSLDQKKQPQIDSFQDLFGGIQPLEQSNKTISLKSGYSNQQKRDSLSKQSLIKQTHSQHESQKTQKLESEHEEQNNHKKGVKKGRLTKIQQTQNQQSQSNLKRCFSLAKIGKADIEKLKKKGYQLIQGKQNDQKLKFELLIVETELKISKILLLSLLQGKQIKTVAWINNPNSKVNGKLQGFLWENIQKKKGKGKTIFTGNKNFYLEPSLQQQFEEVLVEAGGNIVQQLTKSKSKTTIHIIVDEKSRHAKELYEEKKNYKNWSFYSKKMVIESVLMGEEVIDKYKLDSYSF